MTEPKNKNGKKPNSVPYEEYETVVNSLAVIRAFVNLDTVAVFEECNKLRAQISTKDAEIDQLQTALNRTMKQATEAIDEIARLRDGIEKVSIECKTRNTTLNWAHLSLEALAAHKKGNAHS